jgi:hypothetical protein
MYKHFLQQEDGCLPLLVLDTEGIDALDAESEHDVRIFALSVMISSVFVYNSMSHLDEAAVQTLSLMTKVTEALGDGTHSPTLYWVLRDFALQLVDTNGETITHSQYLDQALECPATTSKCPTRDAIKRVFKERHLVTLPRPHRGDKVQKLEHQTLTARFEKFLSMFRSHVCKNAKPFCACHVPLTGNVYVEFVRNIVTKVNEEGSIPKLEDAWTLLSRVQHADKEQEARRALTTLATKECVAGTEQEVLKYVQRVCTDHCAKLVFMPPQPDVQSMSGRLVDDIFQHCKITGKIMTIDKMASTLVVDFLKDVGAKRVALEPSVLLDFYKVPFENDTTRMKAFELFPKVLVESAMLQNALVTAETKGKQTQDFELEQTRSELKHVRECLDDVKSRCENDFRMEMTTREDACMQTDAVLDDGVGEDSATTLLEAEKRIVELESRLSDSVSQLSSVEEKNKMGDAHIKKMQTVYEENMKTIRVQTIESLTHAQRQKEDAISEGKRCSDQKKVLQEECDRLHQGLKEAQERTVDLHRTTLDELRRRNSQEREAAEKNRQECSTLRVQVELTSQENRCLKRQVDECVEVRQEDKRLRHNIKQLEVTHAKDETVNELLLQQVQSLRNELDVLRRGNSELESRLALSEAASKLDFCRRSFL